MFFAGTGARKLLYLALSLIEHPQDALDPQEGGGTSLVD